MNISQLNLPPTPEEVYEQFILQPIPGLGFSVQPPDLGLVHLPEIFYTTEPTTGTYTVDICGYSVVIYAYLQRGEYSAVLETSGRPATAWRVARSTRCRAGLVTTVGPARTIDVVEAHPLLTDPYDKRSTELTAWKAAAD